LECNYAALYTARAKDGQQLRRDGRFQISKAGVFLTTLRKTTFLRHDLFHAILSVNKHIK
jgi:hypothetical protein